MNRSTEVGEPHLSAARRFERTRDALAAGGLGNGTRVSVVSRPTEATSSPDGARIVGPRPVPDAEIIPQVASVDRNPRENVRKTHRFGTDGELRVDIVTRKDAKEPVVMDAPSGRIVISGESAVAGVTTYQQTKIDARGVPSIDNLTMFSSHIQAREVGEGQVTGVDSALHADRLTGTLGVKGDQVTTRKDGKWVTESKPAFVAIDQIGEDGLLILYDNSHGRIGEGRVRVQGKKNVILNGIKHVPEEYYEVVNIDGQEDVVVTRDQFAVADRLLTDAQVFSGGFLSAKAVSGVTWVEGREDKSGTLRAEKASGFLRLLGNTNVLLEKAEEGTIVISSGGENVVNGKQLNNQVYEIVNVRDQEGDAIGFRLLPVETRRAMRIMDEFGLQIGITPEPDGPLQVGRTYHSPLMELWGPGRGDWRVMDAVSQVAEPEPQPAAKPKKKKRTLRDIREQFAARLTRPEVVSPQGDHLEPIPGTNPEAVRAKYLLDSSDTMSPHFSLVVRKLRKGETLPTVKRYFSGKRDFSVSGDIIQRLDVPGLRVDATQTARITTANAYAGGSITAGDVSYGLVQGVSKLSAKEVKVLEVRGSRFDEQPAEAKVKNVKALKLLGNTSVNIEAFYPGGVIIVDGSNNVINEQHITEGVYEVHAGIPVKVEGARASKLRSEYTFKPDYAGLGKVDDSPKMLSVHPTPAEERAAAAAENAAAKARLEGIHGGQTKAEVVFDTSATLEKGLERQVIAPDGMQSVIQTRYAVLYSGRQARPSHEVVVAATLLSRMKTDEREALDRELVRQGKEVQRVLKGLRLRLDDRALIALNDMANGGDVNAKELIRLFVEGAGGNAAYTKIAPERAELGQKLFDLLSDSLK